jgi:glycosyltransferase involved in cell wall biosynthesis
VSARFLFFLTEGFEETVIDSQVVDTLAALRAEGLPFDLLALCDGRAWLERREFYARRGAEIAERTGARVGLRPIVRKTGALGLATALPQVAAALGASGLRSSLIHCRGDWSARIAAPLSARLPGVRYVYDCRGDAEAEFAREAETRALPRARAEAVMRRIRVARRASVAGASLVLAVSEPLRDLLVARYGLDPARARVVPGAADEAKFHPDDADRAAMRRELSLEERFVVVFPGRFGRWHYNEETFEVVRGLLDADSQAFFLVLTPDVDAARALAERRLPAGRYAIRSAQHREVPRFLRAADLGILLRAADPINVAACPTKFGEFVMTGLPVLISAGIGDCSAFVATERAGVVLDAADPAAAVRGVRALRAEPERELRARVAVAGRKRFSRQRHARELATLYRGLVSESSSR